MQIHSISIHLWAHFYKFSVLYLKKRCHRTYFCHALSSRNLRHKSKVKTASHRHFSIFCRLVCHIFLYAISEGLRWKGRIISNGLFYLCRQSYSGAICHRVDASGGGLSKLFYMVSASPLLLKQDECTGALLFHTSTYRLVGLAVWFSLRVREDPGSIPGRAPYQFDFLPPFVFALFIKVVCS